MNRRFSYMTNIVIFSLLVILSINLSAEPVFVDYIVSWDKNLETNIKEYRVYKSTTYGVFPSIPMATVSFESQSITVSLETGKSYYFVVTAVNDIKDTNGNYLESSYSNQIRINVFPPVKPKNLKYEVKVSQ